MPPESRPLDDYTPPEWWLMLARESEEGVWSLARKACRHTGIALVRDVNGSIVIEWCGLTPNTEQLHGITLITDALEGAKLIPYERGLLIEGIARERIPEALRVVEMLMGSQAIKD